MSKPFALLALAASAFADSCCSECVLPSVKYFSVDKLHNMCGESCIDPAQFAGFHMFEPSLTLANSTAPCEELHYPRYLLSLVLGFNSSSTLYISCLAMSRRRSMLSLLRSRLLSICMLNPSQAKFGLVRWKLTLESNATTANRALSRRRLFLRY
jgi:hypothetical protein